MTIELEALLARVTAFVRNTALSVFLPGLVLLLEVWIATGHEVPKSAPEINTWLRLLVLVYAAYIVGFTARYVMFAIAEGRPVDFVVRHLHRTAWQHRPVSTRPFRMMRWGERFYTEAAFSENVRVLRNTYGDTAVDRLLTKHPLLSNALTARESAPETQPPDYREVFHYCKTALGVTAPQLGTETMEIEFNTLFAIVPPSLAAPLAVWRLYGAVPCAITAAIALLNAAFLIRQGNEVRHSEVFAVLRNLLFAEDLIHNRDDTA